MITQMFLDWLAGLFAGLIGSIPPAPPEMSTAIADVNTGVANAVDSVSNFGIIVPFDAINFLITLWLVGVGFWVVALVIKLAFSLARIGVPRL